MLIRRAHPWVVPLLLAATFGLYGMFWLHSVVEELHRRGATRTTPRLAIGCLLVPVFNIVWSVLLVGVLRNAFIKAFVGTGRWPPRDLTPLWGLALLLPTMLAIGFVAPWLGSLAAIAILSFTVSSVQEWLDSLRAIPIPVPSCSALVPDSAPLEAATPETMVDDSPIGTVWLAYRPVGDCSSGVNVLDRGLRRLLSRGALPPGQFEVRNARGLWKPLMSDRHHSTRSVLDAVVLHAPMEPMLPPDLSLREERHASHRSHGNPNRLGCSIRNG